MFLWLCILALLGFNIVGSQQSCGPCCLLKDTGFKPTWFLRDEKVKFLSPDERYKKIIQKMAPEDKQELMETATECAAGVNTFIKEIQKLNLKLKDAKCFNLVRNMVPYFRRTYDIRKGLNQMEKSRHCYQDMFNSLGKFVKHRVEKVFLGSRKIRTCGNIKELNKQTAVATQPTEISTYCSCSPMTTGTQQSTTTTATTTTTTQSTTTTEPSTNTTTTTTTEPTTTTTTTTEPSTTTTTTEPSTTTTTTEPTTTTTTTTTTKPSTTTTTTTTTKPSTTTTTTEPSTTTTTTEPSTTNTTTQSTTTTTYASTTPTGIITLPTVPTVHEGRVHAKVKFSKVECTRKNKTVIPEDICGSKLSKRLIILTHENHPVVCNNFYGTKGFQDYPRFMYFGSMKEALDMQIELYQTNFKFQCPPDHPNYVGMVVSHSNDSYLYWLVIHVSACNIMTSKHRRYIELPGVEYKLPEEEKYHGKLRFYLYLESDETVFTRADKPERKGFDLEAFVEKHALCGPVAASEFYVITSSKVDPPQTLIDKYNETMLNETMGETTTATNTNTTGTSETTITVNTTITPETTNTGSTANTTETTNTTGTTNMTMTTSSTTNLAITTSAHKTTNTVNITNNTGTTKTGETTTTAGTNTTETTNTATTVSTTETPNMTNTTNTSKSTYMTNTTSNQTTGGTTGITKTTTTTVTTTENTTITKNASTLGTSTIAINTTSTTERSTTAPKTTTMAATTTESSTSTTQNITTTLNATATSKTTSTKNMTETTNTSQTTTAMPENMTKIMPGDLENTTGSAYRGMLNASVNVTDMPTSTNTTNSIVMIKFEEYPCEQHDIPRDVCHAEMHKKLVLLTHDDKSLTCNGIFTPSELKGEPKVMFFGKIENALQLQIEMYHSDFKKNCPESHPLYTGILTSLGRNAHLYWIVTHINACELLVAREVKGKSLAGAEYTPPNGHEASNNVLFTIFREDGPDYSKEAIKSRDNFDVKEFAKKHKLCGPIGATLFKIKRNLIVTH